jgi:hypothetical protein
MVAGLGLFAAIVETAVAAGLGGHKGDVRHGGRGS